VNAITPTELNQRHERGDAIHLIDVRTPTEFRESHVPFARNVPLDSLDPCAVTRSCGENAKTPIYVICKGGARGAKACAKLMAAGCDRAVNVEGGTAAWEHAGLTVIRGKKAISLERQVRIAAGTLVLIGSLLGYFVHPYFIGLAAFIGAGLTFAGISDTCGMGLLLARMPWNQITPAGTTGETCRKE
jgi:rhodanese-related sulfurtransferase